MALAYMLADDKSAASAFQIDSNSFFIFANEIPEVAF
jgi:hypothetical protein